MEMPLAVIIPSHLDDKDTSSELLAVVDKTENLEDILSRELKPLSNIWDPKVKCAHRQALRHGDVALADRD